MYLRYTEHVTSPSRFRKWAIIHAIGAAAERRLWTTFGTRKLHPNLFIILVGPPGTGKSEGLNPMTSILRKSQAVAIAPSDMTKQGLLDALKDSGRGVTMKDESGMSFPFDYHFMSICISEMSNFMSQYDAALAGILTDLFDCPPFNEERKRSGAGEMIEFPGISFIMGSATENLGNTISTEMWGSGFMARIIMVFSAEEIVPESAQAMFVGHGSNEALSEEIMLRLRAIGKMVGEMVWEPEAMDALFKFRIKQKDDAPVHNRLTTYVTRRWLHLAKLCMIAALADERLVVFEEDFNTARAWLKDAEDQMPEIFKDMIQHEDGVIFDELRQQLWVKFMATRKPIAIAEIYQILEGRVATHALERFILIMEKADYMQRAAGTQGDEARYIPRDPNKKDFGVI